MAAAQLLPILLGIAWLIPLASFVAILFFGTRMGAHGKGAATVATSAIGASLFLSLVALVAWTMAGHPVPSPHPLRHPAPSRPGHSDTLPAAFPTAAVPSGHCR